MVHRFEGFDRRCRRRRRGILLVVFYVVVVLGGGRVITPNNIHRSVIDIPTEN